MKKLRMQGGEYKDVLLTTNKVNLFNPKTKKSQVVAIKSIIDVPSNRYVKDILVKGAIINTEIGKARITNRPGQEGSIQAVLIE
jgi:small subunit ribosomal protein S8e